MPTGTDLVAAGSGTDSTTYNPDLSAAAESVVLAWISSQDSDQSSAPSISVDGGGYTWTEAAAIEPAGSFWGWWFIGIGTPDASTVTITFGLTQNRCSWSVSEWVDVDTSSGAASAIVQGVGDNGSGTTGSVTLNSFADPANATVIGIVKGVRLNAWTWDGSLVELNTQVTDGENLRTGSAWLDGEDTSPSGTWTTTANWRAAALELAHASGATNHTRAAAVTGTGTVTASGLASRFGTASVAGTATVVAVGQRTAFGVAAVAGVGSVTAIGQRTALGAASVAGVGTITATGVRDGDKTGAASVAGTGTITAVGQRTALGVAAVSGVGTVAASGQRTATTSATITGTGTVTATGQRSAFATALITGTGTITAVGVKSAFRSAIITGTGTITASGFVPGVAIAITAKQPGRFYRFPTGPHLVLMPTGRGQTVGLHADEGWEKVSALFVYNTGEHESVMASMVGVWATHSGSAESTLTTAINERLQSLGYRGTSGRDLT